MAGHRNPFRDSTAKAAARLEHATTRADAFSIAEDFFRKNAVALYEAVTDGCRAQLRLTEVVYAAAELCAPLLPTREDIAGERALGQQSVKQGLELRQGLFTAYVLADKRCGMHLIHAMLRPTPAASEALEDFRKTGQVTLAGARVERRDNVGYVTLSNPDFLNAEDDTTIAGFETAVDLVLLDDRIEAGVLRGDVVQHKKYAGRRVFTAGINLTHLYYGQISLVDFILERDLGVVHKLYRGLWTAASYDAQFEDYQEKPWVAGVEAFAIGGGCQLLCAVDRVVAEEGAYFSLPASKEGFIPGVANLRLPRLVGIQKSREAIFFEKTFRVGEPDGMLLCDEAAPAGEMDAAIERNAKDIVKAGLISVVSNRKALRVGQEPLVTFRKYMATYARQQAQCFYDPALLANIEKSWRPQTRKRG